MFSLCPFYASIFISGEQYSIFVFCLVIKSCMLVKKSGITSQVCLYYIIKLKDVEWSQYNLCENLVAFFFFSYL